jgi:hypothetical protein
VFTSVIISLIRVRSNNPNKYIGIFQYHENLLIPHVAIIPIIRVRIIKNLREKLLLIYDG